MLRIEKLSLPIGDFSLKEIDLHIEKGECHALLGPSGSGKSTLVSALLGLKKPESGEILLKGESILHRPVEERGFGYLPQNLALFPHLSVEENLRYGIRARRLDRPEIESHLQELIDTVEIRPLLQRRPETLSGGERQRVALVRALAPRPRMLLLDEPFSALDPSLRRELWTMVHRIQEEFQTTMLLITHDLAEAYFLSSRITVIIDGCIRQSGSREEVFYHPQSQEVARYLGIRNLFEATVSKINSNGILFEVPALNCVLRSETPLPKSEIGRQRTLAIRSEHIRLTANDKSVNVLHGRLDTFPMGSSTLGSFHPNNTKASIEILFHGSHTDEKMEHIHIPPDKIIVLEE